MAVKTFTSGEVLTAADTNTYLANAGLVYITTQSATSGTTLTLDSIFSSTYDSYRIVFQNVRLASAAIITAQLRTGSTTTSNYLFGYLEVPYNQLQALGRDGSSTGTASSWRVAVAGTGAVGFFIDVFGPNLAQQTSYTAISPDPRTGGTFGTTYTGGIQTDTTQFTGLVVTAGATISNMKAVVYGYRMQ